MKKNYVYLITLLIGLNYFLFASGGSVTAQDAIFVEPSLTEALPDGFCSLIEAIDNANADSTVHGDCPAGNGTDTIVMRAPFMTYLIFNPDNSTDGSNGLPSITSPIIINGNNATIERDTSAQDFRIFHVASTGNLTLNDLTLSNGHAHNAGVTGGDGGAILNRGSLTLSNVNIQLSVAFGGGGAISNLGGTLDISGGTWRTNSSGYQGGAMYVCGGTLTVDGTTFDNNKVSDGFGFADGGVLTFECATPTTATLTDVTMTNNTAEDGGGAIDVRGTTTLTISNSNLSLNTASLGDGGAISIGRDSSIIGTVTINNTIITGNSAPNNGGGIYNGGTLALTDSTVSDNSASFSGGGIYNVGPGFIQTINNSTFTNNQAGGNGGAIYNDSGSVVISASHFEGNKSLTISDTENSGGGAIYNEATLQVHNSTFSANSANREGGGIRNQQGTVQVNNSTFESNIAGGTSSPGNGGGLDSCGGSVTIDESNFMGNVARRDGGGIGLGCETNFTLTNITVSGNQATDFGGGIYLDNVTGTITQSRIQNNESTVNGGGIGVNTARVTISDTTIDGNIAEATGGAVYTVNGDTTIERSTLAQNTANNTGGAVWNSSSGSLTRIINSTLSGNTSANGAGGVSNQFSATMEISFSTITNNGIGLESVGGSFSVKNSLVFANGTADCDGFAGISAIDMNFDLDGTCAALNTDFQSVAAADLRLDATLANNGGSTHTHALLAGSVAQNAASDCTLVDGTTPVTTDQRGIARPQAGICDVGAFEVQRTTPFITSLIRTNPAADGLIASIRLQATDADGDLLTYTIDCDNSTPSVDFSGDLTGGSVDVNCIYLRHDTFTVAVTVSDTIDTISQILDVTVNSRPVITSLGRTDNPPQGGLTVAIALQVNDADGDVLTYELDCDDRVSSTDATGTLTRGANGLYPPVNVSCTYSAIGNYGVVARVRDGVAMAERSEPITVLPDITIQHLEITQGIENAVNSVPLIAGKTTYVRVYVSCDVNASTPSPACPALSGTLTNSAGSSESPEPACTSCITPQFFGTTMTWENQRSNINATLNFVLSATDSAWTSGTQRFTVDVCGITQSPGQVCGITSQQTVTFMPSAAVTIRYVPIQYANALPPNDPKDPNYIGNVSALPYHWLPFSQNTLSYINPAGTVTLNWGQDLANNPINRAALNTKLIQDYAIIPGTSNQPNYVIGWLPFNAIAGTRGYSSTSLSTQAGNAGWVIAGAEQWRWFGHELAHLHGAHHTNFGSALGCPSDNPYSADSTSVNWWRDRDFNGAISTAESQINTAKIDNWGLSYDSTTGWHLYDPAIIPDMMTNCAVTTTSTNTVSHNVWTSIHTYNQLGRTRYGATGWTSWSNFASAPLTAPLRFAAQLALSEPHYLISAVVDSTGEVTADPIWIIPDDLPELNPEPGLDYCLEARDSQNGVLTSTCFDLTMGEEGLETFIYQLPTVENANQIVLRHGSDDLYVWTITPNLPVVEVLSPQAGDTWPASGEVTVSWQGTDADGDTLTYLPYYSPNGVDWTPLSFATTDTSITFDVGGLAGSEIARMRVIVTDGVNTTYSDSPLFNVARHAPTAYISEPQARISRIVGSSIHFEGWGLDAEDGQLGDRQLVWTSDIEGDIGYGVGFDAVLKLGLHTVTLTVTDSDGNQATDSIEVYIGAASTDNIPPITTIEVSGEEGNNDWYVSDVTVTITAQDNAGGSGLAFTDWQLDTVGEWQPYTTPIVHSQEGQAAIYAASTDMAGNRENPPVEANVSLDKTPPTIAMSPIQAQYTRIDTISLNVAAYDSMPGSGLFAVRTLLDGEALEDTAAVDLFWMPLGTHTFLVQAEDYAGWVSQTVGSFELIATLDSLLPTLTQICDEGYVRNRGLCNGFAAHIRAAQASVQRGNIHTAINQLNALLNHLNAQNGRGLANNAFNILDQDVRYVINSLTDDSLTDTAQVDDPVRVAVVLTPEPSATPEVNQVTVTESVTPVTEVPDSEVSPTATAEVTEGGDTEVLPTDTPDVPEEGNGEVLPSDTPDVPEEGDTEVSSTTEPTDENSDEVLSSVTPEPTELVDETTSTNPLTIDIEFAGTGNANHINCHNPNFAISVAILTTDTFDATTVNPDTVRFEGAVEEDSSPQNRYERDVDRDGDTDLLFRFRLRNTTLTCTSHEGVLTGQTFDGIALRGSIALIMSAENVRPVALNDEAQVVSGSIIINVLANDTDANGDTLTVVEIAVPLYGSNQLNSDGTITYTAQAGFVGIDTFTYTITDGTEIGYAVVTIYVGE